MAIDPTTCQKALQAAADVGEFFDLLRPSPKGSPLADLVASAVVYETRVDATCQALAARMGLSSGDLPRRAVASLLFLGVAARLVAPALAAVVLAGVAPEITLETVIGAELSDGRYVLSLTAFAALNDRADDTNVTLADRLGDQLLRGQLSRLVDAFAARYALHPRLLWGNVASVVASAGRLVANHDLLRAHDARHLAKLLLDHEPLNECGHYETGGHPPVMSYRRRSCCLYYQLPNAGVCADCPFETPDKPYR